MWRSSVTSGDGVADQARATLLHVVAASARGGGGDGVSCPTTPGASANAATTLNLLSEPLCHLNWTGVDITGADLTRATLCGTSLVGARLAGCRLERAVR